MNQIGEEEEDEEGEDGYEDENEDCIGKQEKHVVLLSRLSAIKLCRY